MLVVVQTTKPTAVPKPGNVISFSSLPSRLNTYARVATSLRHEAKSLPPAVPAPCSGSALSGKTSFQFFSSGFFGSTRTTRPFGAFLLVRTRNLSPTLSITPKLSSPISATMGVNLVSFFDRSL